MSVVVGFCEMQRLPRSVHGHPRGSAIGVELDVERSHMRLESKPGSNSVVLAESVVDSCVLISNSKLLTNHAVIVRYL